MAIRAPNHRLQAGTLQRWEHLGLYFQPRGRRLS